MRNHFLFSSLVSLILLSFLFGCVGQQNAMRQRTAIVSLGSNVTVTAEIADDIAIRSVGLMNRSQLDESSGMLFIFQNNDYHAFWMKNTPIPLDIIFIDENFTVVDVLPADPCKSDPCKLYVPKEKARYVLEVNQNWTIRNSVTPGTAVKIETV